MPGNLSRRMYLSTVGSAGVAAFAGCNSRDSTESENTSTDTVVFTDTPSPTLTATQTAENESDPIVFDGGDAAALREALEELQSRPGATLEIESGTYRIDPPREYEYENPPREHITIESLDENRINGNGATFVFSEPRLGGFGIENSQGVVLENLTFDYDPVPFTQGTIVDLSDDKRTLTLDIDEAYPSFDDPQFEQADVFASIHTADGTFISGIRADGLPIKRFSEFEKIESSRWKLTIADYSTVRGLETGRKLAIPSRDPPGGSTVLRVARTSTPVVESVNIHASPGFAMHVLQCENPVLRDITIAPPQTDNRLIGSDADGIHVRNCRGGPTIEDCHIERLLDDGIVVASLAMKVESVIDSQTIEVVDFHGVSPQPGDALHVMSQTGVRRGMLPEMEEVSQPSLNDGNTQPTRELSFADGIPQAVTAGDFVSNLASASAGFSVMRNVVRENRANLIRLAARSGVVENNSLEGSQNQTINIITDTTGTFAPEQPSEDITIRNNSIRRSGMVYLGGGSPAAIHMTHNSPDHITTEGHPHRQITVANNDIETVAFRGFTFNDAKNLEVTGNEITDVNVLDYPNGRVGVAIENVDQATFTENRIAGSSDYLSSFGRRHNCTNISHSANQFVLDGEAQTAEFSE